MKPVTYTVRTGVGRWRWWEGDPNVYYYACLQSPPQKNVIMYTKMQ